MHKLVIAILFTCTTVVANAQTFYASKTDSVLRNNLALGNFKNVMAITDSLHKKNVGYFDAYQMAATAAALTNMTFKQQTYLNYALQNAPADVSIQTQLFYNYIATQQFASAVNMQHKLIKNQHLQANNKINLGMIQMDAGLKISNNKDYFNNLLFGFVGAAIPIKSVLTFHGISYLNQLNPFGDINQLQYYLNIAKPIKNGWQINATTHIISYNISNYSTLLFDSRFATGTPILFGGGVSKIHKNIMCTLNGYYANLNLETQFQIIPSVLYYPFNNNKLGLQVDANYFTEKNHVATLFQAIYQPNNKLKITALYAQVNAKNFSELNALLVNNSFDVTVNRFALNITQQVSKNIALYTNMQLERKIESLTNTPYQYTVIGLGIKKTY